MKPLIRDGRKQKGDHIVFDIESNKWTEYAIGGIYDGKKFTTYKTLSGLCKALDRYTNTKIFAHFGGIFDFLFCINHWGLEGMLDSDLVMRGSSVFSFRRDSNTYYDSAGIIPFGLDKAAKAFNVPFQKLEIDHSKKKTLRGPAGRQLIKYLEHDCRALYDIIERFYENPILERTNFKPTLASTSLEVLRKYLKRPIPSINSKSVDEFVRKGYAGGRTEIFRPIYRNPKRPLYYYDFNSLYPSVMREMDVPGRVRKISKVFRGEELSFTDCEVESPKNIYLPLLWKKVNGKFIFPRGKFRGVFPGPELNEALKQGYKINKVYKSIEFENLGKLFRDYIDDLHNIKNNANDSVQKQIAKLLLNAGYGRMAIKRERDSLVIDDGANGITPTDILVGSIRLAKQSTHYDGFSNAAIGALVTSHSRLKLFRTLKPISNSIYYCDTDSVVTSRILPVSNALGGLKLEGTSKHACFLLPKTYIFGKEIKMKGFPKEFAQSLNFADFKMALEGDLRSMKTVLPGKMARIRSTKGNNGNILKVLKESPRAIKSRYDKRVLYRKSNGEWDTRPITIHSPEKEKANEHNNRNKKAQKVKRNDSVAS